MSGLYFEGWGDYFFGWGTADVAPPVAPPASLGGGGGHGLLWVEHRDLLRAEEAIREALAALEDEASVPVAVAEAPLVRAVRSVVAPVRPVAPTGIAPERIAAAARLIADSAAAKKVRSDAGAREAAAIAHQAAREEAAREEALRVIARAKEEQDLMDFVLAVALAED